MHQCDAEVGWLNFHEFCILNVCTCEFRCLEGIMFISGFETLCCFCGLGGWEGVKEDMLFIQVICCLRDVTLSAVDYHMDADTTPHSL